MVTWGRGTLVWQGWECLSYIPFKAETHDATNRCDTLPWRAAATNRLVWHGNHCQCDRILSLQSVTQIQTGLNSCDLLQQQNKRKQLCCTVCTHLRQVAGTKFKSTNEKASIIISFSPCLIWTSLHFQSSKIDYVHWTSFLSQQLVAGSVQTRGLVTVMCRSDLSHCVSRPLMIKNVVLVPLGVTSLERSTARAFVVPSGTLN